MKPLKTYEDRFAYYDEDKDFRKSDHWKELRRKVNEEADGCCYYCQQPMNRVFVDHVIPRSRGGGDDLENLVACCSSCSSRKGTSTPLEWARREAIVAIARQALAKEFGIDCAKTVKIIVPRMLIRED